MSSTAASTNKTTSAVDSILQLLQVLLPAAAQTASIFIHNPDSQHKFTLIVGEATMMEQLAGAVTNQLGSGSTTTGLAQVASSPSAAPSGPPPLGAQSAS